MQQQINVQKQNKKIFVEYNLGNVRRNKILNNSSNDVRITG